MQDLQSQLKEANDRALTLERRMRLEALEALSALKTSLAAEKSARGHAEAELTRATDELRKLRGRPEAELEALRALFADLMRAEAQGRSRLERLQEQVAGSARAVEELEQEREARSRAEAQAMDLAAQLQALAPGAAVATDGGERLRARIEELLGAVSLAQKEAAEERGRARAQAERASAEVEWAMDRARAATQAEQEAKDGNAALARQLEDARRELEVERDQQGSSGQLLSAQVAALKSQIEGERARANAELGKREEALQSLRVELAATGQRAREQAELAAMRRDELADQQTTVARLTERVRLMERAEGQLKAEAADVALRIENARQVFAAERDAALGKAAEAAALIKTVQERDRAQVGLQNDFELAQRHGAEAASALKEALERRDLAESAREKLQAQRDELVARLDRAGARCAELEAAVRHLELASREQAERESSERALEVQRREAAEADRDRLAAEAARLVVERAQRTTAERAIEDEQQRAAQAEWERAGAQSELQETKEQLGHAQSECALLRQKLLEEEQVARRDLRAAELGAQRELRTMQEEAAADLRQSEETAARHRDDIGRLRTELEETRGVLASLSPRRKAALAALEGRHDEAATLLQAALGSAPADAAVHLELGRLYLDWPGRSPAHEAAAEASFARAAELDAAGDTAPLLLGHVQRRRGMKQAARLAYREALRRNPESPAREALDLLDASRARLAAFATLAAAALVFLSGFVVR